MARRKKGNRETRRERKARKRLATSLPSSVPASTVSEEDANSMPQSNDPSFRSFGEIEKVDDELGIVFGWLMVCQKRDDDGTLRKYYDLQGDHIPEDVMLEAAADFMVESRATKVMHEGDQQGVAVFAWPVTEEIAKAYGDPPPAMTGLRFAARPPADVLAKFKSGEYTGFSIGGVHLQSPNPVD